MPNYTDVRKKPFISGINVPWFNGEYAHDLGINEFSDRPFWSDGQGNGWEVLQTDRPDTAPPTPTLTTTIMDNALDQFAGKADLVRIWLWEQSEGLDFTFNSGDSTNRVVGIDRVYFLPNVFKILDKLEKLDIMAYFSLLDLVTTDISDGGYTGTKATKRTEWTTTRQNNHKRMIQISSELIDNAIRPFLREVKGHPAFYGIDTSNEPESADPSQKNYCTTTEVTNFCNAVASAAKSEGCGCRIGSCFFGTATWDSYSTGLKNHDSVDFHVYISNPNDASSMTTGRSNVNGYKTLVAEAGPQSSIADADELTALETIFNTAWNNGYRGVLSWALDWYASANRSGVIDKIQWWKNRI